MATGAELIGKVLKVGRKEIKIIGYRPDHPRPYITEDMNGKCKGETAVADEKFVRAVLALMGEL